MQEGLLRRVEDKSGGRALPFALVKAGQETASVHTTSLPSADGCRAAIFALL